MEQNQEETQEVQESQEVRRGNRGELGVATPGLLMRQRWHEAHFKLVDTSDKRYPSRHTYMALDGAPSLKQFARTLVKSGDKVAQSWLDNKKGALDKDKSAQNVSRITLEKIATKNSRRKVKPGKKVEAVPLTGPTPTKGSKK